MRFLPTLALSVFLAGPARAAAEPAKTSCSRGTAPALAEIACELAAGIGPATRAALVVGVEPTAEGAARPKSELATRLAALVAGALGPGTDAWPNAESEARARTLGAGRPVVSVAARVRGDRLEVTADVFTGKLRFWQRVRGVRAGPVSHGFAERAIDAEVRSFLPKVPLVAREVRRVSGTDPDVVAVACGDLTGDGEPELALVGRHRVALGRIRGDRFEPFASRAFAELVAIAPAPLREPIASAWIPETGVLELGSTDRSRALRLDAKLGKLAELEQRLPWPGGGCAGLAGATVLPKLERCAARAPEPKQAELTEPLDAIAGGLVVSADGRARVVRAGRRARDAALVVVDAENRAEGARVGAQLALGDLDGDGTAELATTLDTLDPRADALIVYSFVGKALVERMRLPIPAGIRAVGVCPARAAAIGPIVLAAGDGMWLVR